MQTALGEPRFNSLARPEQFIASNRFSGFPGVNHGRQLARRSWALLTPGGLVSKGKFTFLAKFGATQALVQLLTASSGLLILRFLTKSEFAAYAITASLLTPLTLISDSGIASGLYSIGGRIWEKPGEMGVLFTMAFGLRRRLLLLASPVILIAGAVMLRRERVSQAQTLGLLAGIWLCSWSAASIATRGVVLRICRRYFQVQAVELAGALARLALIGVLSFIYLDSLLAVAATAAASILQAVLLKSTAARSIAHRTSVNPRYRAEMLGLVKKQFFPVLFFAFQGQITIWLIGVLGSSDGIAEVGALTRLAALFSFFSVMANSLLAPKLARCRSLRELGQLFGLAAAAYCLFGAALVLGSLVCPEAILWLLGGKYSSLGKELVLVVANSVLGGLTGLVYLLAATRAWIWQTWLTPVLTSAVQVLLVSVLDLAQVRQVLWFGLLSGIPGLMCSIYMVARGFITSKVAGHLITAI